MSRRIDTGEATPGQKSGGALYLGGRRGEDYLGRLAKYIPAEIVGLYIATTAMIPPKAGGTSNWVALWTVFGLSFVLVPLYFMFATSRGKKPTLWSQVVLGTLAFPVWVFAMGGPFRYFSWYEGWIASIALAFVTVGFGLYQPKPGR